MSLLELAKILPGYVTLHIHTDSERWVGMPAGLVAAGEEIPAGAVVVKATPFAPYTMEVSIKFEEESK